MGDDILFCRNCKTSYRSRTAVGDKKIRCPNCGGCLSVSNDPKATVDAAGGKSKASAEHKDVWLGKIIGGCRIERKLGRGGMATVYRAKHLRLDIDVAVKIMDRPGIAGDRSFVQRFVREARSAARVKHPNVVGVLDVGRQNSTYYIIMELVEGGNVGSLIEKHGKISPGRALSIVYDIARALRAAADQKLVHRDIKPENIMIDLDGTPKLADLGLVKLEDGKEDFTITGSGIVVGTPYYIAPEQIEDSRTADIRSDIYSLGATLFHMVTGRTPFVGPSAVSIMMKHIKEPPTTPTSLNPRVPEPLSRLILRMMAKKPEKRPQNPRELMEDLKNAARLIGVSGGAGAVSTAAPVRVLKSISSNGVWVATGVILIVLTALAVAFTIRAESKKARDAKSAKDINPIPAQQGGLDKYSLVIVPDYRGSRFLDKRTDLRRLRTATFAWTVATTISKVLERCDKVYVTARPVPVGEGLPRSEVFDETFKARIKPDTIVRVKAGKTGDESASIALVWVEGKTSVEFYETRVTERFEDMFYPAIDRCAGVLAQKIKERAGWQEIPGLMPAGEVLPAKYRLVELLSQVEYQEALADWHNVSSRVNLVSQAFGRSPELSGLAALAMIESGETEAAAKLLKGLDVRSLDSVQSQDIALLKVVEAFLRGDSANARLHADKYILKYPLSARGRFLLGLVREKGLKQLADAFASYKLGFETDPFYLPCSVGMVRVLVAQNRQQHARSFIRELKLRIRTLSQAFAIRVENRLGEELGGSPAWRRGAPGPKRPRRRNQP